MPLLPSLLNNYIIKTNIKINASNFKTFCKPCVDTLGEEEGKKIFFPNKKDRIIQHLKKCSHFFTITTAEQRTEIFNLLSNYNTIVSNKRSYSASDLSTTSQSSGSSQPKHRKTLIQSTEYGPMDNFIVRPLSKEDYDQFYQHLLRMTVSCGWPLSWVTNPEVMECFKFLNPFLKLPDRRYLGNQVLNKAVDNIETSMEVLKEDSIGVTLTFDGWTNVKNEHLLGTILLNSEGKPHVWKVFDISSERENHIEVIKKTELMMHELNENNITLCAIVTDSAGAYAAARRKLRMSYKSVVFLPCFAHQLNLYIGEIFKESTQFKTTIDRAIKLTNYFRNANHQFFIGQLRDIQYNTYKKIYSITAPGETRWNSFFYMCTSLMRTQKALEILAIKFKPPFTESRRRTGDNFIQREIYEIISLDIFWNNIRQIIEILTPYCALLNILQCDKARLFQVVHSMGYLVQFWSNYHDTSLALRLIERLERRWNEWEQPLLLLSLVLHPEYRMKQFQRTVPNVSYTIFGKWLLYYYRAWFEKEPKYILREFDNYRLEKYPFDYDTFQQFKDNILSYWSYAADSTNELGSLACRIFGICINAASVERLWSCMGFIQNNRRGRLKTPKALKMSKLRADITYKHRRQQNFKLYTNLEANTTLDANKPNSNTNKEKNGDETTNENDNEMPNETINKNNNQLHPNEFNNEVSEEYNELEKEEIYEDNEELSISEEDFGEYLQGWAELLEEEQDNEDRVNIEDLDDIVHPALDKDAKWQLENLFVTLELPSH